jgi:hypothetical protein
MRDDAVVLDVITRDDANVLKDVYAWNVAKRTPLEL